MDRYLKQFLRFLLPVLCIGAGYADTTSAELNEAAIKYYAGFPEQAVMLLEPKAAAGDVDAQYLLANILYSLSKTEGFKGYGDPVKWYEMAAEQGVADASFALGVIYSNNWKQSRDGKQAALAITHFQKAVDSGFDKARRPLEKLILKTGMSLKTATRLARLPEQGVIAKTVLEPAEKAPVEKTVKVKEKVVVKPEPVKTTQIKKIIEVKEKVVAKPEPVAEEPAPNTLLAHIVASNNSTPISLAELASECGNYTQIGFNYYAESIEGASLTGSATISRKLPGGWISLTNDDFSTLLLLTLNEVPPEMLSELKVGQEIELSGVIDQAQLVGASCTVNLVYQQDEG